MSSLRRIRASRANGALSKGPKTPEGKRRASANSLRHGLLADCIVLLVKHSALTIRRLSTIHHPPSHLVLS